MAKYSRRKDGRYQYQFRVGYDQNGKRIMRTFYGRTVAELEAKIRNAKSEIGKASGSAFVADYCRNYLDVFKVTRAENTRQMYERSLRYHVAPLFAGIKMRDLTAADIQKAVNSIYDRRRTAEIMLTLLKQICEQATETGIFASNPCKRIYLPPKAQKREKRALSASEVADLHAAPLDNREKAFVFLLFGCGLRREEALGLRLRDVDLIARTVDVRQVITFPENSAQLRTCGKTDKSLRSVPLPASLVSCIAPWYDVRTMSGAGADALLFPDFTKTVYVRFWNKIRQKLGRPELTAYWFRHNYATQLYYSDVSIKQAVALMGHSGTKMILEVYAHLDAEKEAVRGKLDAIFA